MRVPAVVERPATLDNRFAQPLFVHRSAAVALAKKSAPAEVARLEREPERLAADGARPGHAGVDLRPDRQRAHAERLDDRARGLAAGDDERAHAVRRECCGKRAKRRLRRGSPRARRRAPSAPRRSRPAPRWRRRAPDLSAQRGNGLGGDRGDHAGVRRRSRAGRSGTSAPLSRATATCLRVASEQLPDSQATGPGRRRHGPRAAARVGAIAQRARETQGKSRAAGGERQVDAGASRRDQVLVARRVDDRVRAAFGGKRREPRAHGVGACVHVGIRHEARPCPCVCAASTRTRLASVIGVSGWLRMPESDSSTSPTNRWPR